MLDLAGRIDSLNQASLAHEEQEIEEQQNKLRKFAVAATLVLLPLEGPLQEIRQGGERSILIIGYASAFPAYMWFVGNVLFEHLD